MEQLNELDTELEAVVETIPGAQQMMKIDGLGLRKGVKVINQLIKRMAIIEGRIQNLIQCYFPELLTFSGTGRGRMGDLSKYSHPQQFVNLAGLSLREHSSGKNKGQTRITKRGRSRLRKSLYFAIGPLVAHNPAFKALHHYYIRRPECTLKKQQSLIALCCKLLRVLYAIDKKGCELNYFKAY